MVIGTASYNVWQAVTPDDSVDLPLFTTKACLTRAIYVGVAGDVIAVDQAGNLVKWAAVPAGSWLPIMVRRINVTNTTAQNLLAIYAS